MTHQPAVCMGKACSHRASNSKISDYESPVELDVILGIAIPNTTNMWIKHRDKVSELSIRWPHAWMEAATSHSTINILPQKPLKIEQIK